MADKKKIVEGLKIASAILAALGVIADAIAKGMK